MSVNCISDDDDDVKGGGSLIQISCTNKNSNVQMLKAFLISCTTHTKCISRVDVRGWLNANEKREFFLLIDEVFDPNERMFASLLNPYLIQVSESETVASFPLLFEQIVDVSCRGNDVPKKREAYRSYVNEGRCGILPCPTKNPTIIFSICFSFLFFETFIQIFLLSEEATMIY